MDMRRGLQISVWDFGVKGGFSRKATGCMSNVWVGGADDVFVNYVVLEWTLHIAGHRLAWLGRRKAVQMTFMILLALRALELAGELGILYICYVMIKAARQCPPF
jgi:hypothetical protein